ncbi:MAG TPA: hypothetical protein VLQ80_10610 [Candidatus Saccharimonadia bacterium]|nr:hypothetical protein [Candidatus Saccharimonadia bacterium]
MDTLKYELKFSLDDASGVELEEFIPVFHDWIQTQQLEELLIDVADYRHVPQGPGVVLITHDAHYVMDLTDERLGLLYSRRRETHPSRCAIESVEDRLKSVWHCALTACQRLAAHPALHGRLQFQGNELLLRCNDRLQAPNTTAAYDDLCQHLEPFLATLYPGQRVEVEHMREHTSRLTVAIKVPEPLDVDTLLTRLA